VVADVSAASASRRVKTRFFEAFPHERFFTRVVKVAEYGELLSEYPVPLVRVLVPVSELGLLETGVSGSKSTTTRRTRHCKYQDLPSRLVACEQASYRTPVQWLSHDTMIVLEASIHFGMVGSV
jgi:hypothetical protein